jgi:hypothetical protein
MISLKLSAVPSFLRDSSLFQSFNLNEEDDEISFNKSCCKFSSHVNSIEDARHFLSTARYWGSDFFSLECLAFLFTLQDFGNDYRELCDEFGTEFLFLDHLKLLQSLQKNEAILWFAEHEGLEVFLPFKAWSDEEWHEDICAAAAKGGKLRTLQFAHENGCAWDHKTTTYAALHQHMHCWKYAMHLHCPVNIHLCTKLAARGFFPELKYAHEMGCRWDFRTSAAAAEGGHLHCLQYAHEQGCEWLSCTCAAAAKGGHLNCLRYARDHQCPWDTDAINNAINFNQYDCLVYIVTHGLQFTKVNTCRAQKNGYTRVLEYMFQYYVDHPRIGHYGERFFLTPLAEAGANMETLKFWVAHNAVFPENAYHNVAYHAAKMGRLDCLQFALQNGCKITEYCATSAAQTGSVECLQYLHQKGDLVNLSKSALYAATYGKFECLQYLAEVHCLSSMPEWAMCEIASKGYTSVFKFLFEHRYSYGPAVCAAAARHGRFEFLDFALRHTSTVDPGIVTAGAAGGHRHIVQLCMEQGIRGNGRSCMMAAMNGHLDCLQLLHSYGCPLPDNITAVAAAFGHLRCIQYAVEQGCKVHPQACTAAAAGGHYKCLVYLRKMGGAWDAHTCEMSGRKRLICLSYLHENGCPWDAQTCAHAARFGNLDCLRYAHEHGCPWDSNTTQNAAVYGHLACLVYAVERGCALRRDVCAAILRKGIITCYSYAESAVAVAAAAVAPEIVAAGLNNYAAQVQPI